MSTVGVWERLRQLANEGDTHFDYERAKLDAIRIVDQITGGTILQTQPLVQASIKDTTSMAARNSLTPDQT